MGFGGRVSLVLVVIGVLVLAGCAMDVRTDDDPTDQATDKRVDQRPGSTSQWHLTDSPTGFDGTPVAAVHGFAYAAGDMVFEADRDGLTMYDGRTGKKLWDHGHGTDPAVEPHDGPMVNESGPLYVDGDKATVYASARTSTDKKKVTLIALDGATGAMKSSWPVTVTNESSYVVGVTDDIVLLADGNLYEGHTPGLDFVLRGIDRVSGKERWQRADFAPVGISGTTLTGFATPDYRVSTIDKVAAIDTATGEDRWTAPAPAQPQDEADEPFILYVGGNSTVVSVMDGKTREMSTSILDARSGKVATELPSAFDECVGQSTKLAACWDNTQAPLFFDPATGKSVEPLVDTEGATVTALTDDACYVYVDGTNQVLAVGSGEQLSDGEVVEPVQLGNGYALAEGGAGWEIFPGR